MKLNSIGKIIKLKYQGKYELIQDIAKFIEIV